MVLKGIFDYNRQNYQYDRKQRQEQEFAVLEMRCKQVEIWREDVRDIIDQTIEKMDAYGVVNALQLGFTITLYVSGRLEQGTPQWLLWLYHLAAGGSFLFLLMSMWFALHASIVAQAHQCRLLTQLVRPPYPSWEQMEAMRTYGISFEGMPLRNMFRIPVVQTVAEGDLAGTGGLSSEISDVQCRRNAVDPWGLERRGDNIVELSRKPMLEYNHIRLVRDAMVKWQAYDAFARCSMTLGTILLCIGLCYYGLGYALVQDGSPWAAWSVSIVFVCIACMMMELDISVGKCRCRVTQLLLAAGPFFACLATASSSTYVEAFESLTIHLVFLADIAHTMFLVAFLCLCRVEKQPDGSLLPVNFRSILYMDAFGWLKRKSKGARRSNSHSSQNDDDDESRTSRSITFDLDKKNSSRGQRSSRSLALDGEGSSGDHHHKHHHHHHGEDGEHHHHHRHHHHRDGEEHHHHRDHGEHHHKDGEEGDHHGEHHHHHHRKHHHHHRHGEDGVHGRSESIVDMDGHVGGGPSAVSLAHNDYCACGNRFMDDARYCRKCGLERPSARRHSVAEFPSGLPVALGPEEEMDPIAADMAVKRRKSFHAMNSQTFPRHFKQQEAVPLRPEDAELVKMKQDDLHGGAYARRQAQHAHDNELAQRKKREKNKKEPLIPGVGVPGYTPNATADTFDDKTFVPRKDPTFEDSISTGRDSMHSGTLPYHAFRMGLYLLIFLNMTSAIWAMGQICNMPDVPVQVLPSSISEEVEEPEDEGPPSATGAELADLPKLKGKWVPVHWPSQRFRPVGMSCDPSGQHFVISDGFQLYTSHIEESLLQEFRWTSSGVKFLKLEGVYKSWGRPEAGQDLTEADKGYLSKSGLWATAVNRVYIKSFDESSGKRLTRLHPAPRCTALEGQNIKDIAIVCPQQVKDCTVAVLHSGGHKLAECDLWQHSYDVPARFGSWYISTQWLADGEEVHNVAISSSCKCDKLHCVNGWEHRSLNESCVAVGTTHKRTVLLRRTPDADLRLVPSETLGKGRHIVGQEDETTNLVMLPGGYVLVLCKACSSFHAFDVNRVRIVGEWRLPEIDGWHWSVITGGREHIFVTSARSDGTETKLWQFPMPDELMQLIGSPMTSSKS